MSLSKEQIAQIRDFIHSRGFKHIEVEMEILDHVALGVEKFTQQNPEASFEKALQHVHSSFGPMGFSVFEDELIKKTEKKTWTYVWKTALSFFTTRRLVIVLALYAIGLFISLEFSNRFTPSTYHWFFYLSGLFSSLVGVILLMPITRTWFKKSIVMGNVSNLHMLGFLILGQSFGTHTKYLAEAGNGVSPWLFSTYFSITVLIGVLSYLVIKSAFEWTYSTYLRFAD